MQIQFHIQVAHLIADSIRVCEYSTVGYSYWTKVWFLVRSWEPLLSQEKQKKKRSSKSDYYWRNDGNFRTGKSAVFVDGRPSPVSEKSENLSEPIFGTPQIKKYNTCT